MDMFRSKFVSYCASHSHHPNDFATNTSIELTVPRPILDTNSKTVYLMKGHYRYWSRKTDRDRHKGLLVFYFRVSLLFFLIE